MVRQHTGQVVRIYRPDRYTIWDLDEECCFSCYLEPLDVTLCVGDIVNFELYPNRRLAKNVMLSDFDEITPAQARNLVLGTGDPDEEPGGKSLTSKKDVG